MRSLRYFFLLIFVANIYAADRVTLSIVVTNTPSNNNLLTVNSDTRTNKTTVTFPSKEISIGASIGAQTTNLWLHITAYPFLNLSPRWFATNEIRLTGNVGDAITASTSGTWATLTLSTQSVTSLTVVRVPITGEPTASTRTNVSSLLVSNVFNLGLSTEKILASSTVMDNFVDLTESQSVSGAKTFMSVTTSNLVNVGTAISSVGSGTDSEQFGTGATATNVNSLAVGQGATSAGVNAGAIGNAASVSAAAQNGLAVGNFTTVTQPGGTAIGTAAAASGTNAVSIGASSGASKTNSIAIGTSSLAQHDSSIAFGAGAETTSANQIRMGTSADNVSIAGTLTGTLVSSTSSNTTLRGQSTFTSDAAFTQVTSTALANGNNAAVSLGSETVNFKIGIGPTAAFAINGIADGRNGRFVILENATGQAMTIAHDSGVDPTAGNRIQTSTASDVSISGNGHALLKYDSTASRWKLVMITPSAAVSLANPTGTIGLSAVNGAAVTALRSDGAPALSQAITPTWSGVHQFDAGLAHISDTTSLTADNQVVTPTSNYVILNSDNGTAGNRTFLLAGLAGITAGYGTVITIFWDGTNAGELVDDSSTGSYTVRLNGTWTPTQYDTLTLLYHHSGASAGEYRELARSAN